MTGRVVCIAWSAQTSRANELARALDGQAARFDGRGLVGRRTAPLRYVLNSVATASFLLRRRPEVVVVQNPPIVAAALVWAWARLLGRRFLLDSHPASFGRKQQRVWALFLPLHRALGRRADGVIVTVEELADEVRGWGGRPLIVHEAPPVGASGALPTPVTRPRPQVVFVGVFASDEPVDAVLDAARAVPDVDVLVTGDVRKAPPGMLASAPPNVEFVGFVRGDDYDALLRGADLVLVLTTESTSVVRAGYEAVYARRPLAVSDTPTLRAVFPYAVSVSNDPASLARGVVEALGRKEELLAVAEDAAALQTARWSEQLHALRAAAGLA